MEANNPHPNYLISMGEIMNNSNVVAPVLVIAAGAYIDSELQTEFGLLPPSFLPLGNRRLYVQQCSAMAARAAKVLMSVPESFVPDSVDIELINRLGIELVLVPEHLTLGESIVYVINVSALAGTPVALLHGDTLLKGIDILKYDSLSVVAESPSDYKWGHAQIGDQGLISISSEANSLDSNCVLTGFFCFSDSTALVQAITREEGSFLRGLVAYGKIHSLTAQYAADWFDFGHAGTYHRSRRRITTEREFNRLATTRRSVTKSGTKPKKIEAEAMWFENLPAPLRVYTPSYLGRRGLESDFSYSLEYLHLPTLADLFVFGRLQRNAWHSILDACQEVLDAMSTYKAPVTYQVTSINNLYLEKTLDRLEIFGRETETDINAPCRFDGSWLPSLVQMANLAASNIPATDKNQGTLIHGDFCFSNILYDVRAGSVLMIDPRGLDSDGNPTSWGDPRYDIAKLYHSVVGLYDHIIAGNYKLNKNRQLDLSLELPGSACDNYLRDDFLSRKFSGLSPFESAALPISVLLFLSMLPLHSDDLQRQSALLANGMRLFKMMDSSRGN